MKISTNLTSGATNNVVKTALRNDYNVSAVPRLIVDWNLNRYSVPVATNTPNEDDEGFDIERFPIESIVEPLRPLKGATKARVNQSTVSPGYLKTNAPRFYVSDTDDVYKYWTSPYTTGSGGNFSSGGAQPRVTYDRVLKSNKIVIKLENTWASPTSYEVKISKTMGGSFTSIGGTNPSINGAEGTITLYYNGTAWVSTKPAVLVDTTLTGIELSVTSMGPGIKRNGEIMSYKKRGDFNTWYPTTGANSSLNVIAIEAHFEADLSSRLMTVSDVFDMSESSQLYPIGTITTNTASITLSNEDGVFNPENTQSPYYGLIEPNAEVNLEYIFNINGVSHSVQQFKMYVSGGWSTSESVTSIELEDYSKYLKEIKPNPFMVEGKTSTEIVWRVLDSVGYVNYNIQEEDVVEDTVIPVFWTDGEKTVWEILDEIAMATQTAIYIDSSGAVQVRTRQAAFDDTASVDWNLLGVKSGNNLPDIITWSPETEYEANSIEVKYKATKWKINSQGKPAMSKVWEPDSETLTVRSGQLLRSVVDATTHIFMDQKETKIWPFKSKVQVEGEIIQYEGKQFVYHTYTVGTAPDGTPTYSNEQKNFVSVVSSDDYNKYNNKTPGRHRHKNYYTGGLKITERGVWNTEKRNHSVDINNWTTKVELRGKGVAAGRVNPAGFSFNKKDSTATINTPSNMQDATDTFWAFRGASIASSYKSYGTRFMFKKDKASSTQTAGICYQMSGSRENGFYIQVRTSASLSATERNKSNEISIFSRTAGKDTLIGKGSATAIGEGIWYDMDVYHSGAGNVQNITVFINGQLVATGASTAATTQGESGKFGFFAKGKTAVEFEYIYAIARNITEPKDDYGFYDLKYGGIRGGQWEREYVWEMRTRRIKIRKKKWKKETYRHNLYVFDEFGPVVHEVREFDVDFEPSPVRSSYLFNTNEWYSAVPEYTSNPFGAKFIIANTGRVHAVLHGEDNIIYAGAGSAVNQVCVVLGQNLEIAEEESIKKKNESSIRKRGLIESELSSDWIQTKSMANTLANWMHQHWSESVDEVQAEIFGNPLLEIGDIVDVLFPRENIDPSTHKYFVVGVNNSFENGIKTTLTLRRRRYIAS